MRMGPSMAWICPLQPAQNDRAFHRPMSEAGADVRYIQALLGHSKLSTTAIHAHVSVSKLREVHERTHPPACSACPMRRVPTRNRFTSGPRRQYNHRQFFDMSTRFRARARERCEGRLPPERRSDETP